MDEIKIPQTIEEAMEIITLLEKERKMHRIIDQTIYVVNVFLKDHLLKVKKDIYFCQAKDFIDLVLAKTEHDSPKKKRNFRKRIIRSMAFSGREFTEFGISLAELDISKELLESWAFDYNWKILKDPQMHHNQIAKETIFVKYCEALLRM